MSLGKAKSSLSSPLRSALGGAGQQEPKQKPAGSPIQQALGSSGVATSPGMPASYHRDLGSLERDRFPDSGRGTQSATVAQSAVADAQQRVPAGTAVFNTRANNTQLNNIPGPTGNSLADALAAGRAEREAATPGYGALIPFKDKSGVSTTIINRGPSTFPAAVQVAANQKARLARRDAGFEMLRQRRADEAASKQRMLEQAQMPEAIAAGLGFSLASSFDPRQAEIGGRMVDSALRSRAGQFDVLATLQGQEAGNQARLGVAQLTADQRRQEAQQRYAADLAGIAADERGNRRDNRSRRLGDRLRADGVDKQVQQREQASQRDAVTEAERNRIDAERSAAQNKLDSARTDQISDPQRQRLQTIIEAIRAVPKDMDAESVRMRDRLFRELGDLLSL